jgi:hypothetical protein
MNLRRAATSLVAFLLGALLFGVAYTQPPLYYSNQHQYFLHGLARGGDGNLAEDWLANTADPTPVFSLLIAFTYRYLHESLFYVYYLLIFGAYCYAMTSLFDVLSGPHASGARRLVFLTAFIAVHAALPRWLSAQGFGVDYPWYLQAGVANQYLLGAGLQPSVFGVLLVVSVAAFLRDRPLAAAAWAALAAAFHSTYLLSAALLTLAYLYVLGRERRPRTAFVAGLLALLLVAPVLIYNLAHFAPSSPEAFAEAQHLLAHLRLPHHADPERWFDGIAGAQLLWIVAALVLTRGSRLFPVLAWTFTLSLVLTLVQLATGNDTLALLFPWRMSAILVPLATTVILTRGVNRLTDWLTLSSPGRTRILSAACVVVLAVLVAGGAAISNFGLGYHTNTDELRVLEFVRDTKSPSDVYLLPVEVPKLTAAKRGAASLNFTPPPRRREQGQIISVDLQRFRLFTGAPIYVDFKSIPYKDVEVLEWHRRLIWNDHLYQQRDWNDEAIKAELARRRITHVVATIDRDIRCDALKFVHEAAGYRLYRVQDAIVAPGQGER